MKYTLTTRRPIGRKKARDSFRVVDYSGSIAHSYIPTDAIARAELYDQFQAGGITLPPYGSFSRENLEKRDMMVVLNSWWIIYDYKGRRYRLDVRRGACYDGASVPTVFVLGNVAKVSPYSLTAALVHDCLFALKLMSFEDANNIFNGLLKWKSCPPLARLRYMLGVRSFVGKRIYNNGNPDTHWLRDFASLTEL